MRPSEQFETINRFRQTPPVDVEGLAEALGVDVHYAWLDDRISGMLERRPNGKYVISVHAPDPPTRQRFTIAHELGHYILHRERVGDGVGDDRAYRSTNVGRYHNTLIGPREETEANRFAASVLIPKGPTARLQAQGITDPKELAAKLGVSEQAMRIKLGLA